MRDVSVREPGRIGAVTGLRIEASLARRGGMAALASGGRPEVSRPMAERLIAEGATSLLSFGIAGGLGDGLAPGTLIVATAVISDDETAATDAGWCARLTAAWPDAVAAPVFGARHVLATAAAKRALARRSGAVAVDLESAGVAGAARRLHVPFLALRAIADPVDVDLPPAALIGIDDRGRPAVGRVLATLARRPGQAGALLALAVATGRALSALARVRTV